MSKAYITIGLPGSGKSTWAKKFLIDNPETHYTNNDEIREEIYKTLCDRTWSKKIEKLVQARRSVDISKAACDANSSPQDIIIDNTHCNPYALNAIQKECLELGFEIELIDFRHVPVEECIRRDSLREGNKRVGEEVIRKMAKYLKNEQVKPLPKWNRLSGLPSCIIVDIDGTLAEMCDRSPYDEKKVYGDFVRSHVLWTVNALIERYGFKCFICTGRSENCIEETSSYLIDKCLLHPTNVVIPSIDKFYEGYGCLPVDLHMRQKDDRRSDYIVKREMYEKFIKDKYSVFAVFDDRASVVRKCWSELNLPVFRCGVIDDDEF